MTSPIIDIQYLPSNGNVNLFNNSLIPPGSTNSSSTPTNFSFTHGSNTSNVTHESDSSHLFALNLVNQTLNANNMSQRLVDKHLQFPSVRLPGKIQMTDNKMTHSQSITSHLILEYQKLKDTINKSGLLAPNERLLTRHRGQCYWSNCDFKSEIEENFKKHLSECHPFTSSALAQLDISLQRSLHLSSMLTNEQNYLYNMLLHLDQTLKALPPEYSPHQDYHHMAMFLDNIKQTSNMNPCVSRHLVSLHPDSSVIARPNYSQKFLDSLSSVLLRQHSIPQPMTSHLFPTNHISQSDALYSIADSDVTINSNNDISHYRNSINQSVNSLREVLSNCRFSEDNLLSTSTFINDQHKFTRENRSDNRQFHWTKSPTDRNYYRQCNIRPSVSYVNLIKTAILESPKRELSLNEIYVWIQSEFAYFRDKEQKWKNAIRHNLSLHKCFQRKHGKLWTFNEKEYNMKKSRNRFHLNVQIPTSDTVNEDYYDDDGNKVIELTDDEDCQSKKEQNFIDDNVHDDWSNFLVRTSAIDGDIFPSIRADNIPSDDI